MVGVLLVHSNEPPRIPLAYGPGSVSSLEVKEPQIEQQSLSHKGT